jgi:hypothetical protein
MNLLSHIVFVPVNLEVDPSYPERLPCFGNLVVLKGKEFLGLDGSKWEGKHFDGFYILVKVERRWYKDEKTVDHYSCTLMGDREIAVKIPSLDYDLLQERDQIEPMTNVTRNPVDKELLDAIDNFQSTTPDSQPRKYVYLKLIFPDPIKLSGEVLHKGFEDTCSFPIGGKIPFQSGNRYFYYKVARTDTEVFKRGKRETREKQSAGAALFEDESGAEDGTEY